MWGERGFSEQEYVREQQAHEQQEADDPGHIAQAAARAEVREHRKEDRQRRHQRWWRALRQAFGRNETDRTSR